MSNLRAIALAHSSFGGSRAAYFLIDLNESAIAQIAYAAHLCADRRIQSVVLGQALDFRVLATLGYAEDLSGVMNLTESPLGEDDRTEEMVDALNFSGLFVEKSSFCLEMFDRHCEESVESSIISFWSIPGLASAIAAYQLREYGAVSFQQPARVAEAATLGAAIA